MRFLVITILEIRLLGDDLLLTMTQSDLEESQIPFYFMPWGLLHLETGKNCNGTDSRYEINRKYKKDDYRGRYRIGDLTGPEVSKGESGKPWRGFSPTDKGRSWSVPLTGDYAKWIDSKIIPNYLQINSVHKRLDALYDAKMIILPKGRRKWPGLKS